MPQMFTKWHRWPTEAPDKHQTPRLDMTVLKLMLPKFTCEARLNCTQHQDNSETTLFFVIIGVVGSGLKSLYTVNSLDGPFLQILPVLMGKRNK